MSKIMVVKLGSSSVTKESGPDSILLATALESALEAKRRGWDVVLVSSGAVSSGKAFLARAGIHDSGARLEAAVGQPLLMEFFRSVAGLSGSHVSQLLIGESDLTSREQMSNVASALHDALAANVVPVVNGNDVVDAAGSDNDSVAAGIALALGADLLLLLTDVAGVRADADASTHLAEIDLADLKSIRVHSGGTGRGGMRSKLRAAELAALNGVSTRIAGAREKDVILSAIEPDSTTGTLVRAKYPQSSMSERWVAGAGRAQGTLEINLEAETSILDGSSLFASGIKKLTGTFNRGDIVEVRTPAGELLARGITRVSSTLLTLVRALKVEEIADVFLTVLESFVGTETPASIVERSRGARPQFAHALEYVAKLSAANRAQVAIEIVSLLPASSLNAVLGADGAGRDELLAQYVGWVRRVEIIDNASLYVYARSEPEAR